LQAYPAPMSTTSFCLLPKRADRLWGPPSPQFNVYRGSVPAVNRPARDDDHSPTLCADILNVKGRAISTPV